jgi:anti-anti-sigma factor
MENATSPYFSVIPDLGVDVVTFSRADIVDSMYIERLGADLQRHVATLNKPKVVLDMTSVRQLSSGALGMLVSVNNAVNLRDGRMSVAGLDSKLQEIFRLTKLNKVIAICADLSAAKRHVEGRG